MSFSKIHPSTWVDCKMNGLERTLPISFIFGTLKAGMSGTEWENQNIQYPVNLSVVDPHGDYVRVKAIRRYPGSGRSESSFSVWLEPFVRL